MSSLRASRVLLLLTMVSYLKAVVGRNIPPAPLLSTASSTPTPHIELWTPAGGEAEVVTWGRGKKGYQGRSAPLPPETSTIYGHRLLLGSAPPSCQGKCGSCVPCFPIHVSLGGPRAGSVTAQEYYPEAWRCKCDNRTFMP